MAQLLKTDVEGRLVPLLSLSIWTAVLSVVTLGFYRFWMKTRLRRHFWSAIRPDRTPLEYVGKGIEKFTGFLIALVILALLIGVVALILVYASFALFQEEYEAYLIAAVLAIPLIYFASYRAKRYVYARTRWRGIRFGLEPAAGRYTAYAMGQLFLTLITMGVLWPRMTFKLEKFRTDRTFFGTQRLNQGGRWTGLIKPFLPVLISFWVILFVIGGAVWLSVEGDFVLSAWAGLMPLLSIVAIFGGLFFYTRYRVVALRYMANHKTAGGVGLISNASFPRIFWLNFAGYILTNLFTTLASLAVAGVASGVLILAFPGLRDFGLFATGAVSDGSGLGGDGMPSAEVGVFFAIFIYMSTLLFFSVFRQTFVLFPVWRHYAETLTLTGGEHLRKIAQRARDEAGEAEGMAEAFDLGAAI
ncbi:DUF898 family protein [Celeribacter baekdonensis]|uniref:DUF898 domain-containing protein n=2 Tax=Roseobacteraceae TaxID=2854170 RepID=K2IX74_9RHOB|nr:DUF898 family protein [Celeribacter baekdonensis]EKE67227.1 hypothetical protein B30_21040 [Celeribacter baekdonensis B30]|tara:strand:- start:2019 stop:3266 length:1248 start_codon:yes stop_codon:yes gene_type:complete